MLVHVSPADVAERPAPGPCVKFPATEPWSEDRVLFGGPRRSQLALRRRVLARGAPVAVVVRPGRVVLRWPAGDVASSEAYTAGWRQERGA